jgi:uncharacterized protein (TIGR03083 family)
MTAERTSTLTASDYRTLIHAERARIATMLEGLDEDAWRTGSLCSDWSVEQVVAHLTTAANTGKLAWIRSMARAGFNPSKHNERQLSRHLGSTPTETLQRFRDSVTSTIAPTNDHAAWLGEVIVHGQDIARPLGIELTPDPVAVGEVARFFATKDFAVNSRSAAKGLALEATDDAFRSGDGPSVRGPLLDLVMAMAGRPGYCAGLEGDGVDELRRRITYQ